MKVAIDSNIFIYAEGVGDDERRRRAIEVIARLRVDRGVVLVQVLGEVFRVLRRKGGRSVEASRAAVTKWRTSFEPHETSVSAFLEAVEIAARHGLQIWDAVILAASAEAGCSLLVSEDMQEGFVWKGVTIVSPFTSPEHPLLTAALDPA